MKSSSSESGFLKQNVRARKRTGPRGEKIRVMDKNWQQLGSSLNQTDKPFLNGLLVWFSLGLSFLNQFDLGLGWLKLNRTDLGQTGYQAALAKPV